MGCSFTEGVGCWDESKLPTGFSPNHHRYRDVFYLQKPRFHELGWPNRLGKKLGYDKVINLGLGGSSTSGQVKQFFEKYLDKDFSEYDVLIVWLLPNPNRISFYKDGKIQNIVHDNTLFPAYIKFLSNSYNMDNDFINEQLFYRNIIKTICKFKSYSLVSFHLFNKDYGELIQEKLGNDTSHSPILLDDNPSDNIQHISPICGHWNENGYELVSNNMFNWINTTHPNLIHNPVNTIEWEWDGYCLNSNMN